MLRKMIDVDPEIYNLFKKGTQHTSIVLYFSQKNLRSDVFRLYAFVGKADNFVDRVPQDVEGFYRFRSGYERAERGLKVQDVVIKEFISPTRRKRFEDSWIKAFLDAMESD